MKKFLTVFLSITMLMSVISVIGVSAETEDDTPSGNIPAKSESVSDNTQSGTESDSTTANSEETTDPKKPLPSSSDENDLVKTQAFCDALNDYIIGVGMGSYYFESTVDTNAPGYEEGNLDTYTYIYTRKFTAENVKSDSRLAFYKETNDTVIFHINGVMQVYSSEIIGEYEFHANSLFSENHNNRCGYCVYTNNKVYSIADAVGQGLADVEELAQIIPGTVKIEKSSETLPLYGDVNEDGKININDATAIQRYLSGIINFSDKQKEAADFNGTNGISINDVTDIQKMLAKLDYSYAHQLYPVSSGSVPDDAQSVNFTLDKCINAHESEDHSGYYVGYEGNTKEITTVFRTYDEYKRFFKVSLEEYDEKFFENNALIFVYRYYSNVSSEYKVNSVLSKDNVLYLDCTRLEPVNGTALPLIANWNQFISVKKTDVENIEKICISEKAELY